MTSASPRAVAQQRNQRFESHSAVARFRRLAGLHRLVHAAV
jgi:hypothetical protein